MKERLRRLARLFRPKAPPIVIRRHDPGTGEQVPGFEEQAEEARAVSRTTGADIILVLRENRAFPWGQARPEDGPPGASNRRRRIDWNLDGKPDG